MKMKAKTKFIKWYYKTPKPARKLLVYEFWKFPVSINVIWSEVYTDTTRGKRFLKELGFEDD